MKKILSLFLISMSLLLLFGCVPADAAQADKEEPTDAVPTDEELCASYLTALNEWAEAQSLMEIDHVSIDELTVDTLLMDGYRNQKVYKNISMNVSVNYDSAKIGGGNDYPEEYAITTEVYEPLNEALRASEYGYRINELVVNFINLEGNVRNTQGKDYAAYTREIHTSSSLDAPQTKEELYVQTIAYDFAAAFNQEYFSDTSVYFPYGEINLRRFGIAPGSDELYIEIPIVIVGGADDAEREAFKASLEERSKTLADTITGDEAAMQYLTEHGAASITVAFLTPWEKQGNFFYTYSYDI